MTTLFNPNHTKKQIPFLVIALCLTFTSSFSQKSEQDSTYRRYFIGSSLFLLGNFSPNNKPDFIQLNFGYRITPKDVVSIEFITWKTAWPVGIPYGDSFEAPEDEYPGYVRSLGVAFAYQKFLWKGAYAAVHAFNSRQAYYDESDNKIQNGYQLFMTFRLGYHIPLFKNRFFIEPSLAMTHWPINTNVPESFKVLDDKWNNYFLFEPGLHFGVKF